MRIHYFFIVALSFQSCTTLRQQTKLIFEPVPLSANHLFILPEHTKEIKIPVEPDVSLSGLLFEKPGNHYLLLYFQGNAKNLQNFLDNHSMVLNWGYNVLVTDYRGFGKSTGRLKGERQMYADAEKVYEHAIQCGYSPDSILLYGYSMGTSMAAHLASVKKARLLILESPFSSIREIDWVGNKAPRFHLNTGEKASRILIPTLLIHGTNDEVISADHSRRIFEKLRTDRKKLLLIDGGGHGDLRKRPVYKKLITDFVGEE